MHKTYSIVPDSFFIIDHSGATYNGAPVTDYPLVVRDMPSEDRPREKLIAHGPESLTTRELAILLLITGTSKERVAEMANRLVSEYGERNIFAERDPKKLSRELGIPVVKACQIVAAGELGRRLYDRSRDRMIMVKNAQDVYDYLTDLRNQPKEQTRALYLNSRGRVIKDLVLSLGTANQSVLSARDVFQPAIDISAVAVILAHNHPSGDVTPSAEDVRMTEQLIQAGKILGIRVLDHVIIAKEGFASVKADY